MPSLSVNCPGCNAAVDRDVSLTCDLCGRGMHFSCAGLCADEAVMLRRIQRRSPHFKILCVDCNGVFQSPSLSPVLADQQAYLEENVFLKYVRNIVGKEIDSVKDELSAPIEVLKQSNVDLVKFLTEKNSSSDHSDSALSYAAKTKQTTREKIVIKPKDSNQHITQTQSDVLRNVDLKQGKINISQVSSVSGGGLIISCKDGAGQDELKQIATEKLGSKYNVKIVNSLRPKVRVVGISEDIAKDDIITYILNQNSDLIADPTNCSLARHWPTAKNKKNFQAEVHVDTLSYSRILERGSVLVGLTSCSVFDAVSVPRCFNCNGFNHMSRQCNLKVCCPICAGDHGIKACVASRNNEKKCINCINLRNKPENIDVSHAAWEYDRCTAYKNAVDNFKRNLFQLPSTSISSKN
jgi:hypothetical protein